MFDKVNLTIKIDTHILQNFQKMIKNYVYMTFFKRRECFVFFVLHISRRDITILIKNEHFMFAGTFIVLYKITTKTLSHSD